MFIRDPLNINQGDTVYSLKEFKIPEGKFTVGHEFVVTKVLDDQREGKYYELRCTSGYGSVHANEGQISRTKPFSGSWYDR